MKPTCCWPNEASAGVLTKDGQGLKRSEDRFGGRCLDGLKYRRNNELDRNSIMIPNK